jgi:hypothetical protein
MKLGILHMLLNSSAIRNHSSEVETTINTGCSIFQMSFIIFFPTREEYLKDANHFPGARYLHFFFQISRNLRKGVRQPGLGWLKDCPFHLLRYMAIA